MSRESPTVAEALLVLLGAITFLVGVGWFYFYCAHHMTVIEYISAFVGYCFIWEMGKAFLKMRTK